MEVARGTPPRFGNPAPFLTKGGRRSLPPGQHLTAADAPAARRCSLSAGHHFSAPAHPSGRPQQQQAVFRATDYPAAAPCPPVLLRGSEGPTGAGGARRQVREVLRLKAAGVSGNEIARRVGVAPSTVRLTLKRLAAAGLGWPLPAELTDAALEARLFTAAGKKQGHRRRTEPDWAAVHRELKRKHVTLQILWDEYIEQSPDGYRYSRFCELYRGWASRVPVTMRQSHAGGDKLFVDYAGDTVPVIVDQLTGKTQPAQIFVAVLGASNFTYAEASWTQGLADWIGAHPRAFEAIGGVPQLLVPDNAKVAVIKACLYEPQVNRTYAEMAVHYDTAILPARPRRPRDKAKVEAAVLIVERWLLGRLRHRRFYGLAELNAAIGELLRQLNDERPIPRLGVPRRALLEELARPHLNPLPAEPYTYAEWRLRRVGIDYHVEVEAHFYSV